MSLPRSLKPAGILEMALVDVIISKHIPADILAAEIATARQTGKFTWSSLNYLAKEQDTVINTPLHPSIKQMRFADTPGALISSNCSQLFELNRLLSEDLKKLKTPQIESKGDEKKRAEPVAVPMTAPTIRDQLMVRRYKRRSAVIERLPTTQPSLSDDVPEIKTEDFVDIHFPIADEKQLSEAYSEMKTPNSLEKLFIRFVTHKKHREQADAKRLQFLNLPENQDLKLQYDKELAEEEQWIKQAVMDFENAQKNYKEYTGDASKVLKGNDAYQFMLSACPEGIEGDYKQNRIYNYTKILQSKFPNLKLIPEASSQAQPDLRRHPPGLRGIQVDTAPALTEINKILNGWIKRGEKSGRLRAADNSRELVWIFDPESFHLFGQNYLRVYAQLPKTVADLERLKHYEEFLIEKMSTVSATALEKIVIPMPVASATAKAAALQPLPVRSLPGVGPVAGDSKSDESKTVSPPSSAGVSTLGHFAPTAAAPIEAPAKRGGMGARAVHQVVRKS